MKYLLVVALILLASTVFAQEMRIPVHVLSVSDGDTIVVDVLLPWGVTLRDERVREATYDAWESRKGRRGVVITDEELVLGKQATVALEELLKRGSVYLETNADAKRDGFGRLLAKYWVYDSKADAWTDVREYMEFHRYIRHDP